MKNRDCYKCGFGIEEKPVDLHGSWMSIKLEYDNIDDAIIFEFCGLCKLQIVEVLVGNYFELFEVYEE